MGRYNNLKFISAQPDADYFIWQLKIQILNFRIHNIEKQMVILVGYHPSEGPNPNIEKLRKQTCAKIISYQDDREYIEYIPSIRQQLLKKYCQEFRLEVDQHQYFYHDCDIIFNKMPDFDKLLKYKTYQLSDTISYIGAKYIKEKGEQLLFDMCQIVGIDPKIVEKNQPNSGGAQYLLKEMSYEFWDKVERDCVALYKLMESTKSKYNPKHPIQSWTADMWATLWNIWLSGGKTKINKELDFSWASSDIQLWDEYNIYHNAGATGENKNLFNKSDYRSKEPFDEDFSNISNKYCSKKYVEWIIRTKDRFN